jgi:hypothetical protein
VKTLKFGQSGTQNRQNRSTSSGCIIAGNPQCSQVFFCLKRLFTIDKQEKLYMKGFCRGQSSQKNSQEIMSTWSQGMLVPEGSQTIKIFLSQNRIENLIFIILGRFSINKSQK